MGLILCARLRSCHKVPNYGIIGGQMGRVRGAVVWGCVAWISTCPRFDPGSNALPLAFGMSPDAAAAAIEIPLIRESNRRGSEIYYAERTTLATAFVTRERQRLWLQFRHHRLTGWRYDWDRPSTW